MTDLFFVCECRLGNGNVIRLVLFLNKYLVITTSVIMIMRTSLNSSRLIRVGKYLGFVLVNEGQIRCQAGLSSFEREIVRALGQDNKIS